MPTRRRVLRALGAGAAAGLAGCAVAPPQSDDALDPLADTDLDRRAFAQFQGGLRNRGYVDRPVPGAVEVDWALPVNRGDHTAAKSTPVPVPGGDLLVAGDTGTLRRLTPGGEAIWSASVEPAERGIHGTPAVANGTAYVGAYDGALYGFDLASGDREWRADLGDAIGSSPVYFNGVVYIAVEYYTPSGSVAAVDAGSGETLWMDRRPTDHPHSTVALAPDAGRLVVGCNDGRLYAWTFPGLERAWAFDTGGAVKGPVAVHDGLAIFGSWDRRIYGVDLADGREVWAVETGDKVMSGPAVDPGGTAYVGSHDGHLYALAAATGRERWRFPTGGALIGSVTATPGHALVGSYDARFYAVEVDTGEAAWSVAGRGEATSAALVRDGAVYYAERATDERPGNCYRLVGA